MSSEITESTEQFLSGGGEMGRLIHSMDLSKTALGPVESCPQSLRTSVKEGAEIWRYLCDVAF